MISPTNPFSTHIADILKHRDENDAKASLESQRQILHQDYLRDRLTREEYEEMMRDIAEIEKHYGWTPEPRSTAGSQHWKM